MLGFLNGTVGGGIAFAFGIIILYNTFARFRVMASSYFEEESSSRD